MAFFVLFSSPTYLERERASREALLRGKRFGTDRLGYSLSPLIGYLGNYRKPGLNQSFNKLTVCVPDCDGAKYAVKTPR